MWTTWKYHIGPSSVVSLSSPLTSLTTPIAVISGPSRDCSSQEDGIARFGLNPLAMGVQHLLEHLLLGGNHCPCALRSESLGSGSRCILTCSESWLSPALGC